MSAVDSRAVVALVGGIVEWLERFGVRKELFSIFSVKGGVTEGFSVRCVTAMSCSVTGSNVGFSMLNNEEAVGPAMSWPATSEMCSPKVSSSVVGKVGLDEDEILVVFEGSPGCDAVTDGDSVLNTEETVVAVMIDSSVKSAVPSPEDSVPVVKTNDSVSGFMVDPLNEEMDSASVVSLLIPLTSISETEDEVTDVAIVALVLERDDLAVTEEV